jgi:hypothetical protein
MSLFESRCDDVFDVVVRYDLRTNLVRWETNVRNGVCSIEFDRKDIEMNKLVRCGRCRHSPCAANVTPRPLQVLTTLESQFRVFDMRT